MVQLTDAARRVPLSRDRVLWAAVALADAAGIESLNMRELAQELGVVPMALYKHVANKEQLLDGMVDVIVGEIQPPVSGSDWKSDVRRRILSARQALLRHPWASRVIESRHPDTGRAGVPGLADRHVPHRRLLCRPHPSRHARTGRPDVGVHPGTVHHPTSVAPKESGGHAPRDGREISLRHGTGHRGGPRRRVDVGSGCDDQFEFEFALDLLLDGFERLQQQGWTSTNHVPRGAQLTVAVTHAQLLRASLFECRSVRRPKLVLNDRLPPMVLQSRSDRPSVATPADLCLASTCELAGNAASPNNVTVT